MISEWAKKLECWEAVRTASYSAVIEKIQKSGEGIRFEKFLKADWVAPEAGTAPPCEHSP